MLENIHWFVFSLGSVIAFGIAMALYKLPSVKNQSRNIIAFWSFVTPFALSSVFFFNHLSATQPGMIIWAIVWGATFTSIVLLQMYALKHVDTNTLFPVTTTLSLVITVLTGILFFKELITLLQLIGIVLVVVTVYSFLYKRGKVQYSKLILFVGSGIVLISAFNKILQKIVADNFDVFAFQIYQYFFAAIFALLLSLILHRKELSFKLFTQGLPSGLKIGIPSFIGGYFLYMALVKGPFTLITSIHSSYIFITALIAYALFGESLTARKIFLIIVAIIALILIRIG